MMAMSQRNDGSFDFSRFPFPRHARFGHGHPGPDANRDARDDAGTGRRHRRTSAFEYPYSALLYGAEVGENVESVPR